MSNLNRLMVLLCLILCSQLLCAQGICFHTLGIDDMFRLADENSKSIQSYSTGREAAAEALKKCKVESVA